MGCRVACWWGLLLVGAAIITLLWEPRRSSGFQSFHKLWTQQKNLGMMIGKLGRSLKFVIEILVVESVVTGSTAIGATTIFGWEFLFERCCLVAVPTCLNIVVSKVSKHGWELFESCLRGVCKSAWSEINQWWKMMSGRCFLKRVEMCCCVRSWKDFGVVFKCLKTCFNSLKAVFCMFEACLTGGCLVSFVFWASVCSLFCSGCYCCGGCCCPLCDRWFLPSAPKKSNVWEIAKLECKQTH